MRDYVNVDGEFTPLQYLKLASKLLSNPVNISEGRDMVIRALNDRHRYEIYDELLKNLVLKAGLYPYLNSEFESHDIEDLVLIDCNKPSQEKKFVFHATQTKVYNELMSGKNVVLSAPTSMGKSAILSAVLDSETYRKVVLIVPTIALIDETRKKIAKEVGHKYKLIHHNCQSYDENEPTVFILTQERLNQREDVNDVDLFILDEFYKLGFKYNKEGKLQYDERAISLNISVSRLIKQSKQWFFIGPNIKNIDGLSNIVGDFTFICSDFRTVSVNVKEYNIPSTNTEMKHKALLEILKSNAKDKTIIYCRSPRSAHDVARFLKNEGTFENKYSGEFIEWIEEAYDPRWNYCTALKSGIVLHHGILPRAIQHFSIDIFDRSRNHNVLICTSTIIEGVNTCAKNVVVFDNFNGKNSVDRFTYNNIKGRAGRMYKHFIGNVYCLERQPTGDDSDDLTIPLGSQDDQSPLNLLGSIDSEYLSKDSQAKWDDYTLRTNVPNEIIKNNSSFEVEKVEDIFSSINNLRVMNPGIYQDLNFYGKPNTSALSYIVELFIKIKGSVLRNNGLSVTSKGGKDPVTSISGKIRAYLGAATVTEYLKGQVAWKLEDFNKNQTDADDIETVLAKVIDDELKIISNVYGYSIPNFMSLIGDILYYLNQKYGTKLSFDYKEMINQLEYQKLTSGYSALNEMGVPHQTIEKIRAAAIEIDEESIEEICLFIRNHNDDISTFTRVDKYFVKLAAIG